MSDFHAGIPELNAFLARFRGADKIVSEELGNAGKRAGFAVEAGAKRVVRVWRGHLRRSITSTAAPFGTTVSPIGSVTKIGTALNYGIVMDQGRRPGAPMSPPGALLPWMGAKGIAPAGEFVGRDDLADVATSKRSKGGYYPVEYLIARAIGRRGIPGDGFLTKTFERLKPQIRREFQQVPKRVIARLKGGA